MNKVIYCLNVGEFSMYSEWKKREFYKGYYLWMWEQQDLEVNQENVARWDEREWKNS